MISTAFQQAFSNDENALKILQEHGRIKNICWRSRLFVTAGEILNCIRASRSKVASFSTYTSDTVVSLLGRELLTEASDPGLVSICRKVFLFKGKAFLFSPRLALYIALRIECEVSNDIRKKLGLTEAWEMLSRAGYGKDLAEAVGKVVAKSVDAEPAKTSPQAEKVQIVEVKSRESEQSVESKPQTPIAPLARPVPPTQVEQKSISVYADASVIVKKAGRDRGTTLAIYCPDQKKGYIKFLSDMCLHIDQAEMLAIALAYEHFPDAKIIYTDSKYAATQWEYWRDRASEVDATSPAAPIRHIMFQDVQIVWIPREKNAIADYLTKKGGESWGGWFRVRQIRPPDDSSNWLALDKINETLTKDTSQSKGFAATQLRTVEKIVEKKVEVEKVVEAPATVETAIAVLGEQIESINEHTSNLTWEIAEISKHILELEQSKDAKKAEAARLLEKMMMLSEVKRSLEGKDLFNVFSLTDQGKTAMNEWLDEAIHEDLEEMTAPKEPHLKAVA